MYIYTKPGLIYFVCLIQTKYIKPGLLFMMYKKRRNNLENMESVLLEN